MNSRKFLCSSILVISVFLTVLAALSIAGQVDAVKATLTGKNKVPPALMDAINKTQLAKEQGKNTGGNDTGGNDTKIFDRLNDLRGLKLNESGNPEKVIGSAGAPANGFYAFIKKWGTQGSGDGQFVYPHGIAIDSSGNVYVADSGNSRIQKFTSDGTFIREWGSGGTGTGDGEFYEPTAVAVDSSGNVYVADVGINRIQKFTSDGTFIKKFGTEGSGNGQFRIPWGVAVDSSGRVYVADDHNFRIQVFLWKLNVLNPIEPPITGFK